MQYGIKCTEIVETSGGLSASAYKIKADNDNFFLKVYDKRLTQTSLWIENIDNYMPILLWLNKNTKLQGKIINPITTSSGNYRYEDEENVFTLFEYIKGEAIAKKPLTDTQITEIAEIMGHLHSYGQEIPIKTDKIRENFNVNFCSSLENFISDEFAASPEDIKVILQPCLEQLILKINETKSLSNMVKQKSNKMVLCHTDAHGWNLMQSDHIVLVDWEGMKLAPAEADLFMFAKKDYWDIFLKHYSNIRPEFKLDQVMLSFYTLRRKLEDIWAFLESILYDDLPDERRISSLAYLANECKDLNAFCF
jgi:thiamine kinase-like enzyme